MSDNFLRPEVLAFAHVMESRLRANNHKGGWKGCDHEWLRSRVDDELREMDEAGTGYADEAIVTEAADAANFLMMYADVLGALGIRAALASTEEPRKGLDYPEEGAVPTSVQNAWNAEAEQDHDAEMHRIVQALLFERELLKQSIDASLQDLGLAASGVSVDQRIERARVRLIAARTKVDRHALASTEVRLAPTEPEAERP